MSEKKEQKKEKQEKKRAAKKERTPVASGIFLGYFVLILHLLLIVGVGVAVVFLRGLVAYMEWILAGGLLLILFSGYYFYRRLRKNGQQIQEILKDPAFRGQNVEVSFLGGMASLRIGRDANAPPLGAIPGPVIQQIEDPETMRRRELSRLADLFEKELITREEFQQLKDELLTGVTASAVIL